MLAVDLHIPHSRSLKAKRAAVRPIVEGARRRFGVSASEVDGHDTWQRARLGFAVVAPSPSQVETLLDRTERFVWSHTDVEVLAADRHWMELET